MDTKDIVFGVTEASGGTTDAIAGQDCAVVNENQIGSVKPSIDCVSFCLHGQDKHGISCLDCTSASVAPINIFPQILSGEQQGYNDTSFEPGVPESPDTDYTKLCFGADGWKIDDYSVLKGTNGIVLQNVGNVCPIKEGDIIPLAEVVTESVNGATLFMSSDNKEMLQSHGEYGCSMHSTKGMSNPGDTQYIDISPQIETNEHTCSQSGPKCSKFVDHSEETARVSITNECVTKEEDCKEDCFSEDDSKLWQDATEYSGGPQYTEQTIPSLRVIKKDGEIICSLEIPMEDNEDNVDHPACEDQNISFPENQYESSSLKSEPDSNDACDEKDDLTPLRKRNNEMQGEKRQSSIEPYPKFKQRKRLTNNQCNKINNEINGTAMSPNDPASKGKVKCSQCHVEFTSFVRLKHLQNMCMHCQAAGSNTTKDTGMQYSTNPKEKIFVCAICLAGFTFQKNLEIHMKRHEGNYKCKYCTHSFDNEEKRDFHMEKHEFKVAKRRHKCSVCVKEFKQWTDLRDHWKDHPGQEPYRCTSCSARFFAEDKLKSHSLCHTAELDFKCCHCSASFNGRRGLIMHMQIHSDMELACTLCDAKYKKWVRWERHMREEHSDESLKCKICGSNFKRLEYLRRHMKRIHGPQYKCSFCDATFSGPSQLQVHAGVHTGEHPFFCSECNVPFCDKKTLQLHKSCHSGDQHFQCDKCSAKFNNKRSCTIHMRVHR